MSNNFKIKIDLRKKIVGFECFRCEITTCKYIELKDKSIKVTCPECQNVEIFRKKPIKEGERRPLQWLFS